MSALWADITEAEIKTKRVNGCGVCDILGSLNQQDRDTTQEAITKGTVAFDGKNGLVAILAKHSKYTSASALRRHRDAGHLQKDTE